MPHYALVQQWLADTPPELLDRKRREAELLFRRIGITFSVYSEGGDPERLIPFDIIPRVLSAEEWRHLAHGLTQRVQALNAFLGDAYHRREIVRAGLMPAELIVENSGFIAAMQDFNPPHGAYTHVAGIDIVRVGAHDFFVLEDNCRTPSGVSYMLENREAMMRLFPDLYARHRIAPVANYPEELRDTLRSVAPAHCEGDPVIALLTPGPFNSAYYEHSFLADEMGVELVEGVDLVVKDAIVYMRTTEGPKRVDVIYRRIDDAFVDPTVFRPDSMLGCAGLFEAYRAGNVTLANAIGAGIADDKAVYPYVPEMIRFYLGEEPILSNVPTYSCGRADDLAYVLDRLDELVVKETHGSGGYGMLVGPQASRAEIDAFATKLRARPGDYIAQPTLALSTCPTYVASGVAPRHVDLRPFVLRGREIRIVPGGLTRVALRAGSLVVNSSQGGGTKDTWVLED
ncbi:MAG TPA: circularly permuted type 2 ATP-grasp protein [Stellaceae bacterium]|nr:circularly permuted type 2 ATP-grasp protein [Stellaceae bacterium]